MAINTEFSRILFKRSTVTGVVPTIPTGTTIDNTWLTTDIMVGEGFLNTVDDRFWFRTDNGLLEFPISAGTNTYTTSAYLSGSTIWFNRTDGANKYSVNLSAITLTGDYLPLTGGTLTGDLIVNSDLTVTGTSIVQQLSATTMSILNSGSTGAEVVDYSGNRVKTGVSNSTIVAGSGNTINSNLRNVLVAGANLTATTSDTAYFSKVNINNVPAGTSVNNLGIDASGNVIIGDSGLVGDYLPLTVTGTTFVDVNDNLLYFTGNTGTSITTAVLAGDANDITQATVVSPTGVLLASQDAGSSDYFYAGTNQTNGSYLEYNTGSTVTLFKVNKSSVRVQSAIANFPGITYDIDYSANYTNRSLVDKEYVDGLALSGASSGWLPATGSTGSVVQDNSTGSDALANYGLAANSGTTAQGIASSAFGVKSTAKGLGSVAFGNGSVTNSPYSFIHGVSSTINTTANNAAILAGQSNAIGADATDSAIIGGTGNTINGGVQRTLILGGHDIVADRDDSVYVNALQISDYAGTATRFLGLDSSNGVVTASTASIGVGTFLALTGGTMSGDITTAFNKGIKYDATRNIKFEGAFGYTGTTINGGSNSYVMVGNRYDGGIEIGSWEPNAVLGLYANTGSIEIYDTSGIVINDNNKVEIGVDSKEEITLADNTAGATTSTNVDKKAVTIGSKNSKFNSGVVNSVILGGSVITASTSNTVYVPSLNVKTVGAGTPIINLGLDSSGNVVTGTTGGSAAEQYWTSGSTATSVMPTNPGSAFATITNAGATSFLFGWNSRVLGGSDNYNLGFNSDIKGGQANWNIGGNNQVSDAGGDIYAFAFGENMNVRGWSIGIGYGHTMTNGSNAYGNVAIGYNNYHVSTQGAISLGTNNYVNAANSIATGYNTRTNASYSWAGGYSSSSTYRVIANSSYSFAWMASSGLQELGTYAEYSTILGGLDHNIASTATGSTIIGGAYNRVNSGVVNSTVLGGNSITATTSNTVYVPRLNIVSGSTPASSGATGDVGTITYDANYAYIKTTTGWGRIALDYNF